jgi:hypothetical protein
VPLLRGERPADWRTSRYYRYYHDPAHAETVAKLKTELYRLKQEVRDNDEFANAQPPPGADGQPPRPAGKRKL